MQKGWKRALALWFVCYAVRKLNISAEFKKHLTDTQISEFCDIHGIVVAATNDISRVDANMTSSLVQNAARERPNCFKWVHQVKKKQLLGVNEAAALSAWQSAHEMKRLYGVGLAEASAVINLCKHMPDEAVNVLRAAAAKFGVVKGPITHSGLGSCAMTVGWGPEMATAGMTESFKNVSSTVILMARKCVAVYSDAPVSLRKSKNAKEVEDLQLLCRGFELALHAFQNMVPDQIYQDHASCFADKFMAGFMDATIMTMIDSSLVSVDINAVPEFRHLLSSIEEEDRRKEIATSDEIKSKLMAASFEDLQQRLQLDKDFVFP